MTKWRSVEKDPPEFDKVVLGKGYNHIKGGWVYGPIMRNNEGDTMIETNACYDNLFYKAEWWLDTKELPE